MDDEPQLVVELDHDALAEPMHAAHDATDDRIERRLDAAQGEHVEDRVPGQRLADDPPLERFNVDRDVGELGHRAR